MSKKHRATSGCDVEHGGTSQTSNTHHATSGCDVEHGGTNRTSNTHHATSSCVCRTLLALLLALILLASCAPLADHSGDGKLSVVTTIFAPYDLARAVGGDAISLKMLLPPAAEAHTYEPTPADIIAIQNCDVFICIGGENEAWVDGILASMDTADKTILRLLDIVEAVEEEVVDGMEADAEDEPDLDDHVWTYPMNAIKITETIRDVLCEIDNANADSYSENAAVYVGDLLRLDADFKDIAANAVRKTIVFGDRFPFRYLADAYGLEYYAAFPGCASESEPSAKTVAFLINIVNNESIPVVYHAEMSNGAMCQTISDATAAEILELHACHSISSDDFKAGVTYIELMSRNVEALKRGLW